MDFLTIDPELGWNRVHSLFVFRRVFIDTVNGLDTNDGSAENKAVRTWEKVTTLLRDTAAAEIVILSNLAGIVLSDCPNVFVVVPDGITVTSLGIRVENSNVRFTGELTISQCPKTIEVINSNVVFNGLVRADAVNAGSPVIFVDASSVSVVRFKELILNNEALHANTVEYAIEDGSEVYVAGYAQHRNPYWVATVTDPGEGGSLPDGHIIAVVEDDGALDAEYVF